MKNRFFIIFFKIFENSRNETTEIISKKYPIKKFDIIINDNREKSSSEVNILLFSSKFI
tara:strand:+ start:49 stop:225 length:177 start_codon:yes stop_codon:yes gene_type:complete